MTASHFAAWKVSVILFNVAVAVFVALDPTVQVAVIGGGALILANVPALIIAWLNRKELRQMSINVDGNLRQLLNEKAAQTAQMTVQSDKLAHAEGHAEGIKSEQERKK